MVRRFIEFPEFAKLYQNKVTSALREETLFPFHPCGHKIEWQSDLRGLLFVFVFDRLSRAWDESPTRRHAGKYGSSSSDIVLLAVQIQKPSTEDSDST